MATSIRPQLTPVERHPQRAAAADRGVSSPGLVGELDRVGVAAGPPRLGGGASRKDLLAGRRDHGPGRVARAQRRERRRWREIRVQRRELLGDRRLGGRVLALAEVKPAQGAALAPEEQGGPALAAVVVPDRIARVVGDRMADAEPLQRRCQIPSPGGEGKAR